MTRKNFTLSIESVRMLQELSQKLNLTHSDIVRRAIELLYEQKTSKMETRRD